MEVTKPSIYARAIQGGLVLGIVLACGWGLNESVSTHPPELPEIPSLTDTSETRSVKNWLAHWFVDQAVSTPRERRFLSGPPATDPSRVIREVGSDGIPVVDHAKGW